MTPLEFRRLWEEDGDELTTFLPASLEGVRIGEDARSFLQVAGLPEEAAPYVSFESSEDDPLPTVEDEFPVGPDYKHFRVIGSTGSGDPICLDENDDGALVYLNHDNNFKLVPVNKSVSQLAESLLVLRQFIHDVNARNGKGAYSKGNIPPDLRQWLEVELRRIDQQALQPQSFWADELENLDSESSGN